MIWCVCNPRSRWTRGVLGVLGFEARRWEYRRSIAAAAARATRYALPRRASKTRCVLPRPRRKQDGQAYHAPPRVVEVEKETSKRDARQDEACPLRVRAAGRQARPDVIYTVPPTLVIPLLSLPWFLSPGLQTASSMSSRTQSSTTQTSDRRTKRNTRRLLRWRSHP